MGLDVELIHKHVIKGHQRTGKPHMSASSNNHQADVKTRWERQERERRWCKTGAVCDSVVCVCEFVYVKVLCVNELYVTKLGVKGYV